MQASELIAIFEAKAKEEEAANSASQPGSPAQKRHFYYGLAFYEAVDIIKNAIAARKPCGHCFGAGHVINLRGHVDGYVERDKLVCPVCQGKG